MPESLTLLSCLLVEEPVGAKALPRLEFHLEQVLRLELEGRQRARCELAAEFAIGCGIWDARRRTVALEVLRLEMR